MHPASRCCSCGLAFLTSAGPWAHRAGRRADSDRKQLMKFTPFCGEGSIVVSGEGALREAKGRGWSPGEGALGPSPNTSHGRPHI